MALWAEMLMVPDVELRSLLEAVRPAWTRDAACQETPGVSFFPKVGASVEPARRVCADCLVRQECLDHALVNNIRHGVWGGTSERERKRLRTSRRQEVPDAA